MTIYIGADHRGFDTKVALITWLTEHKYEVIDCGNTQKDLEDDYPDFAFAVADRVSHDMEGRGIVICGGGAGVTVAANKVPLVRCVQGFSVEQVKAARNDDDITVLALGSDFHTSEQAIEFVQAFLETPYGAKVRYDRRIQKIMMREAGFDDMGGGCCGGGGGCACGHDSEHSH